jgi:iron complex transport system substrate-binding protein
MENMSASNGPNRIACLQPSATVILASVGELDRVVACTKYCAEVVPEVLQRERLIIADSWTSKADEILAAAPDLVIAAVPYQAEAVGEILKAGIRFLGLAPRTLADIYTDIAVISAIVGASERGERLIADMQNAIEDVRDRTSKLPRKRVFCEEWGKPLITSQPWVKELVTAAGGDFMGDPGKQIASDAVTAGDPEVIIAAWCGASSRVPLSKIIRHREWGMTTAARTAQIYCISDELLNTPAPTLTQGLHALAAAIHPEIFASVPGLLSITDVTPAPDVISHKVV